MKFIQLIVLTVLSINLSISSQAQKVWTLEDCINHAIDNNITVKRQELSAEAASKTHFQSLMEVLPNANANANHFMNSGKALNTETYTYENQTFQGGNFNFSSEMTVFNGLQNLNTIRKNKLSLLSQLESVERVKNNITINVSTSYLQILLSKELQDNAQQQVEITRKQIEKTKKLVEIGNASKGDLLQIQSQAAAEEAALTDAKNNLKIAYLDLAQLLYLEDPDNFEIVFPEIPDITLEDNITSVVTVYNDALEFLPEIKSAELFLKSTKMDLAISYGNISPRLALGYQYQSRYNELANSPYIDQIGINASQFVYVALQIPIFNNWSAGNSISQAKIAFSDSKLNLDLQKQNLYRSIQQVRTQAIASMDRYKANLEAVKSMKEAFRYTEQKYQVGLVDILEYNTAKNQLNQAKSDLAQAKYEYIFRTKILDFYRGEQITL